ncbi:hypothetical protein KC19_7G048400 [Ceratodon purpureus]|uniref:Protein kinase domain-containing protein n=1 Tax=Ceratodon purpureus TaxID=3225 RepID=A0A8T0H7P9_CERPU|nr:hypothetical protein KC19_7G048400 [Ceratodon purpureus]
MHDARTLGYGQHYRILFQQPPDIIGGCLEKPIFRLLLGWLRQERNSGRSTVRLRNQCIADVEIPDLIVFAMESFDPASKTDEIFLSNGDTLPARFNVDSKNIVKGEQIGEGNLTVYRAHWLGCGLDVAVKEFAYKDTFRSVKTSALEVTRMLNVRHPNVLKLYGFYLKAQEDLVLQCSMIMELMDCDLHTFTEQRVKDGLPLSDDEVVYIATEIARGMQHIHKSGYVHRDLKPQNVLIKKSLVTSFHVVVKIADFGSSEALADGNCDRKAGTTRYKAPEQFDGDAKLVPAKLDVYSFGCICFKLLTGEDPPWKDPSESIKRLDSKCGDRNLRLVVGIIRNCVAITPEARPDFDEICGILGPALEEIWSRQARPEATFGRRSSRPPGFDRDREGRLKSIVDKWKLPKDYTNYVIPSEDFFVRRELGEGGEAVIYEVEWNGTVCAMKSFPEIPELERRALRILPKLVHRNIVTFMGYTVVQQGEESSAGDCAIVMEILERDLLQFLEVERLKVERRKWKPPDRPILCERRQWEVMKGIAEGMVYLHRKGVCHGDLKPQNVIVSAWNTEDVIVKLIDFIDAPLLRCTTAYAAPEVLVSGWRRRTRQEGELDQKKADVYSFGITCSSILASRATYEYWFENFRPSARFREGVIDGSLRPVLPKETRADVKRLVERCWDGHPSSRPDFSEICHFLSHTEPLESKSRNQCTLL